MIISFVIIFADALIPPKMYLEDKVWGLFVTFVEVTAVCGESFKLTYFKCQVFVDEHSFVEQLHSLGSQSDVVGFHSRGEGHVRVTSVTVNLVCWITDRFLLISVWMQSLDSRNCIYRDDSCWSVSSFCYAIDMCRAILANQCYHFVLCHHGTRRSKGDEKFQGELSQRNMSYKNLGNYSPYVGQKIGEAKNPGPQQSFHAPKNAPRTGRNFAQLTSTLAIVNPTSLANKKEDFQYLKQKYGIQTFACAETTATVQIRAMFGRIMRSQSFHCLWSKPVDPQRIRIDGQPSLRGKVGGTAIFSLHSCRHPWNICNLKILFQTRLVHGVFQIGATWIQIITIYCLPSNVNGAKDFNNELVQAAVNLSETIPLPVMFVGDFNSDVRDFRIYPYLREQGFTSIQDCYREMYGKIMPPTCKDATTPDSAIIHPFLARLLVRVEVDKEKIFDTHDPVILTFRIPSEQIFQNKIRLPETWTKLPITKESLEQVAPIVLGKFETVDTLQKWANVVEETVSTALESDRNKDPTLYTFCSLPKKYCGRCKPRTPKKCPLPNLVKTAWDGHYNPGIESITIKFKQLVRQLRRIQSLHNRIKKMKSFDIIWHRTIVDVNREWLTIRSFVIDNMSFDCWIDSIPELCPCPYDLPSEDWIVMCEQFFKHRVTDFEHHEQKTIASMKRIRHQTDVKFGHKVDAFKKAKGVDLPPFKVIKVELDKRGIIVLDESHLQACIYLDESLQFALYREVSIDGTPAMVRAKDDCSIEVQFQDPFVFQQEDVHVFQSTEQHDEKEIFKALNDYWFQFWRRDPLQSEVELPEDGYISQFIRDANLLVDIPEINELSLEDWKQAIQKAKARSAPGIDGITFEEMKQLPDSLVAILAEIVAKMPVFPKEFMVARTVPLPKVETVPFAKDSRPITILPTIYRIWSRVVATKILQVLGATLPPQVTGMLPSRGALNASYNFQFVLERARALRNHLSGVTLDLRKCFNLICRQKLRKMVIDCGIPEAIVSKWISSLQEMQRYWQVGQECSFFFDTSTGCPEGDSLSVVAMVFIAWLWVEGIIRIQDDMGASAYADNWTWWAVDPNLHQPAFQRTLSLTDDLGLEIDWQKTWRWETSDSHATIFKQIIAHFVPTGNLELMTHAWDLGTPIAYKAMNKLGKMKLRFDKAKARLNRIQAAPWDLDVKVQVVVSAVYSVAFYACEMTCIGQQHLDKFRSVLANCLIGDSSYSVSPAILMHCVHAKLLDPGLFVILQAIKMARRFLLQANEQDRQHFLFLASRPSEYVGYCKGPASALREYLLRLGWTIDKFGMINVTAFLRFNILQCSFQRFVSFALKSWQETLIVLHTSRTGLYNMLPISRSDTIQILAKFESSQRIPLLRKLAGAFQTNVQKAKWADDANDTCAFCKIAQDTKFHRTLECPVFAEVRKKHQSIVDKLVADESQLPELPVVCQYPHEEFLTVTEFSLPELIFPENVISYCYNCPSLVHIYTDGSCQNPSNITFRFATYCVVIDWCQTDNERIHEARCFQETGKIPDTLQIVGYARCRIVCNYEVF